ncbi:MAG TPA: HEAT repeat domain-containing protein [Polyangiales bacterium]
MSLEIHLDAIFDADRKLRSSETSLLRSEPGQVARLLASAVEAAKQLSDRPEAEMRLSRLADLCAQVPSAAMVEALIQILDDESPSVRVQAAEALVDVAYDRYAEVARAIERAVERGQANNALRELPWVVAEVAEPSATALLKRFLAHADAEVVGSAIEALASLGDPSAVPALSKLKDDTREVTIDDGDEEITATLGELVREAIDTLGQ